MFFDFFDLDDSGQVEADEELLGLLLLQELMEQDAPPPTDDP